jgi:hypothetical protein
MDAYCHVTCKFPCTPFAMLGVGIPVPGGSVLPRRPLTFPSNAPRITRPRPGQPRYAKRQPNRGTLKLPAVFSSPAFTYTKWCLVSSGAIAEPSYAPRTLPDRQQPWSPALFGAGGRWDPVTIMLAGGSTALPGLRHGGAVSMQAPSIVGFGRFRDGRVRLDACRDPN